MEPKLAESPAANARVILSVHGHACTAHSEHEQRRARFDCRRLSCSAGLLSIRPAGEPDTVFLLAGMLDLLQRLLELRLAEGSGVARIRYEDVLVLISLSVACLPQRAVLIVP